MILAAATVRMQKCASKKSDYILEPAQIVVSINNLSLYIVQTGCPHHKF
jgi:hypothetical protein